MGIDPDVDVDLITPLLKDLITVHEVEHQIRKMKRDSYTRDKVPNMSLLIGNVHKAILTLETYRCNVYKDILTP